MPTYGNIFKAHRRLARSLKKYSLASLVSSIGGLMTMPEFQASALRFEVLQHFAVAHARGTQKPRTCSLKFWLRDLGEGWVGRMEDPAEDVFVSRVCGRDRDYLIFEGLYETPAFCLQRFVDILDNMPQREPFASLRRSAYALLALSNETVKRSGVAAFTVGRTQPIHIFTEGLLYHVKTAKSRVIFTAEDLNHFCITYEDIKTFIFDKHNHTNLDNTMYNDLLLNRHPLLEIDNNFYLTLPASISMAIRCMIIEFCLSHKCEDMLNKTYANEITNAFQDIQILNSMSFPFLWRKLDNIFCHDISTWIDQGRALHICFIVDNFSFYKETGFSASHPNSSYFDRVVEESILKAHKFFSKEQCFYEGLSLIVMCSWGRPMILKLTNVNDMRWRAEAIGAPELISMSGASSFSPLDLWNLLDMRDKLSQSGINLININGLFNLYAWSEKLDGHLIPDEQLPDTKPNQRLIMPIPQNSLLEARRASAQNYDIHCSKTWDKRTVRVMRFTRKSFFKEDENAPLYFSLSDLQQKQSVAVYETESRGWWLTIETPNSSDHDLQYRLFEAIALWLKRSAKIVETIIQPLPEGPILWVCCFEEREPIDFAESISSYEQAKEKLNISTNDNVIRVNTQDGFLTILSQPENIGERLLVEAFVDGVYRLSGQVPSSRMIILLVQQIVPDQWARYVHFLDAENFRDSFQDTHRKPILISNTDDAFSRIGLGWLARKPNQGARIEGVKPCCEYLNNLVAEIGTRIQSKLKSYNREQFLLALLNNHEDLQIHFSPWFKTPRAVLSLHRHKENVAKEAVQEVSRFEAASLSTRLLIEIALCECSQNAERCPGRLDISRLLADVALLHIFGGWSDAIRYESKSPRLRITPSGDLHTDVDFDETVAMLYRQTIAVAEYQSAANVYEEYFHKADVVETTDETIEFEFQKAWIEAFGFTIDNVRFFMDALEDEGHKRRELVFSMTEAELFNLDKLKLLDIRVMQRILAMFSLSPRPAWNFTPPGFRQKDWHPWRFRRRLSLISRPIIQISDTPSRYLIAPGLIRSGIMQTLKYCYRGSYDARDFSSRRMRSWFGKVENKRGHVFNKKVAEALRDFGWETRSDIKVTEIINKFSEVIDNKTAKTYGDIDVLAWKADRVLIIECKDLESARSISEISRQIYDFRGKNNNRNKPDRMMKHLLRIELLNSHKEAIKRFLGGVNFSSVEGLLVFSRIVPMHFTKLAAKHSMRILTKDQLVDL